jgi:hypothetical protein
VGGVIGTVVAVVRLRWELIDRGRTDAEDRTACIDEEDRTPRIDEEDLTPRIET